MFEYRTKKEDALDNDLEVHLDCIGVNYQGNFFKRSLVIYTNQRMICTILDRWNNQGSGFRLIEGSFAPIHYYKVNKIFAKGL